ncbi:PEP-CTERM-box response regulator transcription factor [Desulfobacterota bacterium M19]
MKKKLLVIEDEQSVAKQLRWSLDKEYEITIAADIEQARPLLASGVFPVATMDLGLPPYPDTPEQGFALLKEAASLAPHTRVIVITGNTEQENAIKAVALGAADFCAKPIDLKILKIILQRTFHLCRLEEENRQLQQHNNQSGSLCGMLGISAAMTDVFARLKHASSTDYPVLISGSTGTGKEMAARAVHNLSSRAKKPLIIINCGAIPENLLESELFGHEKGAFTGASARRIGKFEQADQGTIFLDEIGELPLPMQVKILRVLQESTLERLGGTRTININVRVIAATNVDLEKAVTDGTFRQDLFYRLNVIPLHIPDLCRRPEDILPLAHKFLAEEAELQQRPQMSFSATALAALSVHKWPGNVRELRNCIRRALGTSMDKVIFPADMGLAEANTDLDDHKVSTLKQARDKAEIQAVRRAMGLSGNNISQAAKYLAISRPTLHDLLKKHGIQVEK